MSFTVQEVAQLLKQAKENDKPYVFFTGAGCSISAGVPSATGLIKEICNQFPIQVKNIDHEQDQFNYGKYMSALDKDERRRILKSHIIDNKKINWAHIALACLMKEEYIQRVLTFNFDSILSRACNLLGLYPSIYDLATANPHLYHLINDPSIVHLHGQGTGFIQLNTKKETQDHTEKLGDFIAATLNSNPSLFIGYSGNADEFFPLLEKKYSEQHRLIWTGRKESIEEIEASSVKGFLKKNNNLTHYIGNIDADHFLIQLAKELNCFPPELFSNPYKFLGHQLSTIQPYPLGDGLDILENLSGYLEEQSKKPLIKSLYTAFIHKYPDKVSVKGLSEKAINEIIWAYDQQAQSLIEQKKFHEGFILYDKALSIHTQHFGCLHNYAFSLSNYAESTNNCSMYEKAFRFYDQAIKLQPINANAIGNYGNAIFNLAELKKDQELFKKAFSLYEKGIKIKPDSANLFNNYGLALSNLAKLTNNENLFTQAIKQFEIALEINPNEVDHIENYGTTFLELADLTKNDEFLEKAYIQYKKVLNHRPDGTYNLGCYYSLKQNIEQSKINLLNSERSGTLPPYNHLINDIHLNNIRNKEWFIELLGRLKNQEEETEKVS